MEFTTDILSVFDKKWALLTAGKEDSFNTMTISWGGLGTIWNKPVVTVYVKPIRYTYNFMENNDYFTISFYDEKYKNDLLTLGTKSGKDCDKISLTKLSPLYLDNCVSFNEANITIICKKIYYQDLDFEISDEDMEILNNVKPLDDYGKHDFFPVFKHSGE